MSPEMAQIRGIEPSGEAITAAAVPAEGLKPQRRYCLVIVCA